MSPGYLSGECMSSRSGGNKFSLRQMEQFSLPVVKREKFKKFLTVIIYRNKHFLSLKKGKSFPVDKSLLQNITIFQAQGTKCHNPSVFNGCDTYFSL